MFVDIIIEEMIGFFFQIWGDLREGIEKVYKREHIVKKRYIHLYTYPLQLLVCCIVFPHIVPSNKLFT